MQRLEILRRTAAGRASAAFLFDDPFGGIIDEIIWVEQAKGAYRRSQTTQDRVECHEGMEFTSRFQRPAQYIGLLHWQEARRVQALMSADSHSRQSCKLTCR